MAGVSSLLKSAAARRQKIQDQQDALVAYEYSQSAKTYDDFQQYSEYLRENQKNADPSKALTYEKNINSAQSAYISNEVQRQSINVMEGNGDLKTKQEKIIDLYYQAASSGNYDLAQSLRSQIDSLSIQIQNQADTQAAAGQALAGKMSTLRANSIEDAVSTVQSYVTDLGDLYKKAGTEEFQKQIKTYAKELGLNENAGFFDVLTNLATSAVSIYDDAIASETDPDNIKKFQAARNKLATGDSFDLPGTNGKSVSVSLQDLKDQADANRVGEELISTVQTADGTVFKKNKTTGFVFGRDENGNYRQIPLYGNSPDYTSSVYRQNIVKDASGNIVKTEYLDGQGKVVAVKDKNGKVTGVNGSSLDTAGKYDYVDLLKRNGINARNENGYLTIENNGNIPGFMPGQEIQAYVGPDGELQVSNGADIFNLAFDQAGTFKGVERYLPSAITQVNGSGARFNNDFLATQDLGGLGDKNSLVGIVDQKLAARYLTTVANFAAGTVGQLNIPKTPNIVQPTVSTQAGFNPNPSTYNPQVATAPKMTANPMYLPPQPKLVVAAPAPTPKITSVGVAKPAPIVSVGVAHPGTVSVGVR